ncbi:hypothetical protein CRG98_011156, partial [Punica granatum]
MISICASGGDKDMQDNPLPFVIDYTPEEPTIGFTGNVASPAPFIIDIPAQEPYSDGKVPWTYEGSIGSVEQQFIVMGVTRSGRVYENPAAKDRRKAPATEIKTVPENSPFPSKRVTEEEAEAFMKIVKASEYKVAEQMAKSPAHISLLALLLGSEPHREALLRVLTPAQVPKETPPDRIEEIVGFIFSNTISFSDDELLSEGWSHSRALYIVCKCNNYIIGRVMIDNRSALNVCSVTTLKQMNVDLNQVRPSKTAVRAFDGSRREVNGEIDLLIDVGPCSFSITFQIEPSRADRMIGKVLLRSNYVPSIGLGARGQGISHPIEIEEYKHRRGLGFRPSCHEIIKARRGHHLHRLAAHYGRLNRGIPVPPLSPVYAVTEEIPSGVHIHLARENEELDNWTSVPRYSAVTADVLHSNPNPRHFDSNLFQEHLEEPRTLKIGTALDPAQRARMIDFLKEYQEVLAWSYADMPGLDPSIVEHFLPLDTEKFPPKRQQLRRQRASLLLRIKEEVVKQINAGFLEVCNYSEWVANIVPVEKKDGR